MKTETNQITGGALVDLLDISRGWDVSAGATGETAPAELWTYSYREIPGGLYGTACELFTSAGDPYQVIEAYRVAADFARKGGTPSDVYAVAVVCWGWAAPLDTLGGGTPAEHPQRRRVRLVATIDNGGNLAGRCTFPDNGETFDDGTPGGPLADALRDVFRK